MQRLFGGDAASSARSPILEAAWPPDNHNVSAECEVKLRNFRATLESAQ